MPNVSTDVGEHGRGGVSGKDRGEGTREGQKNERERGWKRKTE